MTSPALASSTLSSTTADLRLGTRHPPAFPECLFATKLITPIYSLIYYCSSISITTNQLLRLTASSTLSSSVTALSTYSAHPTSFYHQQQQASSSRFTVPKTYQQISIVIIHLLYCIPTLFTQQLS